MFCSFWTLLNALRFLPAVAVVPKGRYARSAERRTWLAFNHAMVRFWVGKSEDNFSGGDDDLGYRLYTIIVR